MQIASSSDAPIYVLVGVIARPHGIKGELSVHPYTEQPEDLCGYSRLFFAADDEGPKQQWTPLQARVSGRQVILRLRECENRTQAEALVGWKVWLDSADLPALQSGEFYLYTLLGKEVQSKGGQQLGIASHFLAGSGQDILVIRQGKREYLVPAVRAFVSSIDATTVTLDLPEGLLEINR